MNKITQPKTLNAYHVHYNTKHIHIYVDWILSIDGIGFAFAYQTILPKMCIKSEVSSKHLFDLNI